MTTWTERRTSDLIDGLRAGVSVRSISGKAGGPAVLKTSAIKAGRFDPRESKPILPADLPRAKCPVAADSIIISRMNTPALVGDVGYVEKDFDSLFLPDRLWIARSKHGSGTDIRWLTYHFSSQAGARALRELATGTSGSMKNIPKDKVLGLKVLTPTPPEQRAIADALTDADKLINSLERLISKKQSIKQGMMQELLTGNTRLSGFTSKWESKTIGQLCVSIRGGGTPSKAIADYWGGQIPWATVKDLSNFNPKGTLDHISTRGVAESAARVVPAGELIVSVRMLIARAVQFSVDVAINQDLKVLNLKQEVDPTFLRYWFNLNEESFARAAGGSTVSGISTTELASKIVDLPPIEEQAGIAHVLQDADEELNALMRRLQSARNVKDGMMQELLTGRTRLLVEEISS